MLTIAVVMKDGHTVHLDNACGHDLATIAREMYRYEYGERRHWASIAKASRCHIWELPEAHGGVSHAAAWCPWVPR